MSLKQLIKSLDSAESTVDRLRLIVELIGAIRLTQQHSELFPATHDTEQEGLMRAMGYLSAIADAMEADAD